MNEGGRAYDSWAGDGRVCLFVCLFVCLSVCLLGEGAVPTSIDAEESLRSTGGIYLYYLPPSMDDSTRLW